MSIFSKLGDALRFLAPSLAAMFGSPISGTAYSSLSMLLFGRPDASEDEILKAIMAAAPEMLFKIKQLDKEMAELANQLKIDLFKSEQDERSQIRQNDMDLIKENKEDKVKKLMVISVLAINALMIIMLYLKNIPVDQREIFVFAFGNMTGFLGTIVTFYFGSSLSNDKKDNIISTIQNIKSGDNNGKIDK